MPGGSSRSNYDCLHVLYINPKVDNSQGNSNLISPWGWRKRAAAFFPRLCFHFCHSTFAVPLLSFHFCYSNVASVLSSVVNCACDDLPTVQGGVPARFHGLCRLRSTVGGVN